MAHHWFPESTAGPGAYALVGMGTAFAGIVRTPLTSVIMIFEVTRDYTIIVPLMISNLVAFFISQQLQPEPIYEALSRQEGVHLPTAESRVPAGPVRVGGAMRGRPETLGADMAVSEALERTRGGPLDAWPVVGTAGLLGMLRGRDLAQAVQDGGDQRVRDVLARTGTRVDPWGRGPRSYVHPDHGLGVALSRMGATGSTVLPVVSRADVRNLLGIVTLEDLLEAFGLAQSHEGEARRA